MFNQDIQILDFEKTKFKFKFKFMDFEEMKFKFIDFEKMKFKFKFIDFEKTKLKFIDFEKAKFKFKFTKNSRGDSNSIQPYSVPIFGTFQTKMLEQFLFRFTFCKATKLKPYQGFCRIWC